MKTNSALRVLRTGLFFVVRKHPCYGIAVSGASLNDGLSCFLLSFLLSFFLVFRSFRTLLIAHSDDPQTVNAVLVC